MAAKKPVKGSGPMKGAARKQYVAGYLAGKSGKRTMSNEGKGSKAGQKGNRRGLAEYRGTEGPKKSSPAKKRGR